MNNGWSNTSNKVSDSAWLSSGVFFGFFLAHRDSLSAAKEEAQEVRICMGHLRRYNDALIVSNTIRMRDAFRFLEKKHKEEMKSKTSPDEEHVINITDTERVLFNLFRGIRRVLLNVA